MKNSAGRGRCYPPSPKAEVDNIHVGYDHIVGYDPRGVRTPLHGLYRCVRSQRVGFLSRFGHK